MLNLEGFIEESLLEIHFNTEEAVHWCLCSSFHATLYICNW